MKEKNLRLLGREESPNRQPSIQEIIKELQEEIARGEEVYTAEELRLLRGKLAEYERILECLLNS